MELVPGESSVPSPRRSMGFSSLRPRDRETGLPIEMFQDRRGLEVCRLGYCEVENKKETLYTEVTDCPATRVGGIMNLKSRSSR